jgi:hypothetical protein
MGRKRAIRAADAIRDCRPLNPEHFCDLTLGNAAHKVQVAYLTLLVG